MNNCILLQIKLFVECLCYCIYFVGQFQILIFNEHCFATSVSNFKLQTDIFLFNIKSTRAVYLIHLSSCHCYITPTLFLCQQNYTELSKRDMRIIELIFDRYIYLIEERMLYHIDTSREFVALNPESYFCKALLYSSTFACQG